MEDGWLSVLSFGPGFGWGFFFRTCESIWRSQPSLP